MEATLQLITTTLLLSKEMMTKFIIWAITIGALTININATADTTEGDLILADAKLLIEHNASDEDTGFQFFVDGEPWNELKVFGPNGAVLEIKGEGNLEDFGLTEGFFETNEPPNSEVPISEVLSLFPQGQYLFTAINTEDEIPMIRQATLTHAIPAEPEIISPTEDQTVPIENFLIDWNPVTQTINETPANIIGYQVIVVEDLDEEPGQSFLKNELSVFLPSTQTSISVPSEFLKPGTDYEIEVLAIEVSGNQTIGIQTFSTEE